jgi:hypothetical protein
VKNREPDYHEDSHPIDNCQQEQVALLHVGMVNERMAGSGNALSRSSSKS